MYRSRLHSPRALLSSLRPGLRTPLVRSPSPFISSPTHSQRSSRRTHVTMNGRVTLLRPPPEDTTRAPIENALDITELGVLGPDMFTNTRQPWHPPGARGIFGGVVIAQCIAAGQRTVAPTFAIHSCHCYFLLAGLNDIPITYHVERVRDGRSFATRTVQARQRGRCIFTTTMSFVKTAEGKPEVRHAAVMPAGGSDGPPDGPIEGSDVIELTGIEITEGRDPSERRGRHWVRSKGKISSPNAHVAALGYVTDWFFLGTIPRVHEMHKPPPTSQASRPNLNGVGNVDAPGKPQIGMMVSLDHSIYFHEPGRIKADEWMFVDMESPWAGNGRGVVTSRVFSREGVLLATCVQEGVVRLKEEKEEKAKL